jgi:hypothetical protein
MAYETPAVVDYGDLLELTGITGVFGTEDGGSKALPLHHNPSQPQP